MVKLFYHNIADPRRANREPTVLAFLFNSESEFGNEV